MNRTLGNQALWCAAAFFPDKQALQTVNVLQSQLVVWSMCLSKQSAEDWVEFRIRSFRAARWAIYRFMGQRWSTWWLTRTWNYTGHRARCSKWQPPPPCALLNEFRSLAWWSREQREKEGTRHPTRFFPKLMGEEIELDRACGQSWRDVAQDRGKWKACRMRWVEQQDLPWASHSQLAIEV